MWDVDSELVGRLGRREVRVDGVGEPVAVIADDVGELAAASGEIPLQRTTVPFAILRVNRRIVAKNAVVRSKWWRHDLRTGIKRMDGLVDITAHVQQLLRSTLIFVAYIGLVPAFPVLDGPALGSRMFVNRGD